MVVPASGAQLAVGQRAADQFITQGAAIDAAPPSRSCSSRLSARRLENVSQEQGVRRRTSPRRMAPTRSTRSARRHLTSCSMAYADRERSAPRRARMATKRRTTSLTLRFDADDTSKIVRSNTTSRTTPTHVSIPAPIGSRPWRAEPLGVACGSPEYQYDLWTIDSRAARSAHHHHHIPSSVGRLQILVRPSAHVPRRVRHDFGLFGSISSQCELLAPELLVVSRRPAGARRGRRCSPPPPSRVSDRSTVHLLPDPDL